jgi:hypothetical protein
MGNCSDRPAVRLISGEAMRVVICGGGVEGVVVGNWLARADYRYSDYGTVNHAFFQGTNTDEVNANTRLRTDVLAELAHPRSLPADCPSKPAI